MKLIEPSLLSLNKDKAFEQLSQIKSLGIRFVHYDVMDGQFVNNTAYKTEYLEDLKNLNLKANVHLMVQRPEDWINLYQGSAINSIVFHAETQSIPESKVILDKIHAMGLLTGIAVKPHTDLNQYKQLFKDCDIILVMSVEPGFGGQGFVNECISNIEKANSAKEVNPNLVLQIDGGINIDYVKKLYNQIDWFVTGSWFFKNIGHMDQYLNELKNLK